nr:GPI inositol-deacylase-like [Halyomorpha halys]
MGGMIAKGLFLESNVNPGAVELIVTLATPHQPALLTDHLLSSYYSSVNNFWDKFNSSENNVNLISIGGGPKDKLVRSDLTMTEHADLSVMTSMIPGVWTSVDHLSILWCNQLVLALVRALFDSIDVNSKQLSSDRNLRKNIFSYHLLNRGGGKSFHSTHYPEELNLLQPSGGKWIEMAGSNMLWEESRGINHATHIIISLATPYDSVAIEAVNQKTRDWIFACALPSAVDGVKICKQGINLSSKGKISPPYHWMKRKSAIICLSQLRRQNFTHLVIRTLPTWEKVAIHLDLFKKRDRLVRGTTFLNFRNVIIPKTANNASYYSVELPDMSRFWHGYRLFVEPIKGCGLPVFGRATIEVPWSHEGSTKVLSENGHSIEFTLLTGKVPTNVNSSVNANIYLDPRCNYKVSLEKSLLLSLTSVVTLSGPSIIAHIACCLLFCIGYQAKCLGKENDCPLIQVVLPLAAKPYFIIQASALSASLLQSLTKVFPFLPDTDIKIQAGFVELIVVPFFLHLTAFCLTFVMATSVIVMVVVQGQAFNGLLLKFLKRYSLGINWLSEYILNGVSKVPVVVSAFMITVAFSASGGLALCVGLFFYIFKLISLYEDFWEEIVYWPLRYLKWRIMQMRNNARGDARPEFQIPSISEISFHLSLILLWLINTLISIPSILVWAKNYKYSNHLEPDPYLYCAVVMSVCVGYLWQSELPKGGLKWSRQLGYALIGLGLMVMVYGQTSLYRIPYFLCSAFVLITIHQALVPFISSEEDHSIEQTVVSEIVPEGNNEQDGILLSNNIDKEENEEVAKK